MHSTIINPGNLSLTGDAWLQFAYPDDEEAHAEANTYKDDRGHYFVGWYLNAVGMVTYVGAFDSQEAAHVWLESQGYEDYSS